MTLWLRSMFNKPLAEITLTIAGAYANYIVADQLFEVSAVLATVFLGEHISSLTYKISLENSVMPLDPLCSHAATAVDSIS